MAQRPPPSRQDILDALESHGLTAVAAEAVADVGEDLRRRTLRSGREYAAMVSARTGRRLGRVIEGTRARTVIAPHLQAMVPGHPYAQVHTHPASRSASDADGFTLVAAAGILAMVIIGADGTWYLLSKVEGGPVEPGGDPLDVATEVARAFLEAGGEDDPHGAWEQVAARFRLRYQRV